MAPKSDPEMGKDGHCTPSSSMDVSHLRKEWDLRQHCPPQLQYSLKGLKILEGYLLAALLAAETTHP